MSYGITSINADGYLTFSEGKTYYQYQETLTSSDATVLLGQRFYWDTTYDGATYPLVFIYSNGYWGAIIDVFRKADNTWRIHVWTEGTQATNASTNMEGYVFSESGESATAPSWGMKINDASGNRVYDSDFDIIKVKDFVEIPAPQDSYVSCTAGGNSTSATTGVWNTNTASHGVTGLTKPAVLMYANGIQHDCCPDFGCIYIPPSWPLPGRYFCAMNKMFRTVQKVDSRSVHAGWAYAGASSYGLKGSGCDTPFKITPSAHTTPIIDGNDY